MKTIVDSKLYTELLESGIEGLHSRIAELAAENAELENDNEDLKSRIDDYRQDYIKVVNDQCPHDEIHCGGVPILRRENRLLSEDLANTKLELHKYQTALILITTMPELSQATTIAREALQERGKFIWTEQSVGEYWVTKLDILQDKFDTLEKDYADVCQKRLEAAEVWSRQIIELESENAELEAERRWIPVSEGLPEDGDFVLGWGTEEIIEALEFHTEYGDNCFYNIAGDTVSVTHWMPLPEPPEVK